MHANPTAIFIHYLRQLHGIIAKIDDFASGNADILDARLSDDMLPLAQQVRITANFALRACCPLAATEVVSFDGDAQTFSALYKQVADTVDFLHAMTDASFACGHAAELHDTAGCRDLSLPRQEYLLQYALPNFIFHLSQAYAIARHCGVPLGKNDFDGYHAYPQGFSFTTA